MRTFTATSKQRRQRQVQVRFDGGTIRDLLPTFILFFSKGDAGHEPGELLGSGGGCPDESRGHETNARLHPRREARALAVSAAHPREACVACFRRDGSAQLCDFWRVVGPLIKKQKEGGYAGVSEKMTNRALHLLSLELGAPVGRQRETAQAGSWSRWAGRAGSAGRCGRRGCDRARPRGHLSRGHAEGAADRSPQRAGGKESHTRIARDAVSADYGPPRPEAGPELHTSTSGTGGDAQA